MKSAIAERFGSGRRLFGIQFQDQVPCPDAARNRLSIERTAEALEPGTRHASAPVAVVGLWVYL